MTKRETKEQLIRRLFKFEPEQTGLHFKTLAEFHEYAVHEAMTRFQAKTSQDQPPVCLYIFEQPYGTTVCNTPWQSSQEKSAVMHCVHAMIASGISGIRRLAAANEVWIAQQDREQGGIDLEAMLEEFGQVRNFPNREEALMVMSEEPKSMPMMTKWVVVPKPNPRDTIIKARDDVDMSDLEHAGQHFGYFKQEQGK
jgi:hypothetical protein